MITYFDTSVVLKLLVDDEAGTDQARQIWVTSDLVATAQLTYAEARAALAAARRAGRLTPMELRQVREAFEALWIQFEVIAVTSDLVRQAGDLAEQEALRGYDAVHLAAALVIDAEVMASADRALCDAAMRHNRSIASPI